MFVDCISCYYIAEEEIEQINGHHLRQEGMIAEVDRA